MNALFFTYAYPPLKYPRSIQIARLVKYSAHAVTVVCCDDLSSAKDLSIPGEFVGKPVEVVRFRRKERSRGLFQRAINAFSFPDAYRSWAIATAREMIHSSRLPLFDVLVTFGQPMSDHLAGLEIKKATGLPWVAHFSDPWADNPFHGFNMLRRQLDKHYERRVLESADMLIFTSQQTIDLVMRKYPSAWTDKCKVLPHAYDPELYFGSMRAGNGINVRYLGNFYPPRSPEPLIKGLRLLHERNPAALKDVCIELIGNISGRIRLQPLLEGLPNGLVMFGPPVEYLESLKLMAESNLLLVIDAPFNSSVFLPSKLVDYVGAGKPVFAITPPGAAAELVSRYGGVVANPDDPEQIAERFGEVIAQLRMGKCEAMVNHDVQGEYSSEHVVAEFDKLLSKHLRTK